MPRPIRAAMALFLLAPIGCSNSTEVVDVPSPETQKYGPPAGTQGSPVEAVPNHPAFSDPGQPPIEANVPTNSGATATVDTDPGPFMLHPPADVPRRRASSAEPAVTELSQPPADAPATADPAPAAEPVPVEPAPEPAAEPTPAEPEPAAETPTVDEPEEPGTSQP